MPEYDVKVLLVLTVKVVVVVMVVVAATTFKRARERERAREVNGMDSAGKMERDGILIECAGAWWSKPRSA